MFSFQVHERDTKLDSKIFTTIGALPGYVDPVQPSSKKQPWRSVQNGSFVHSLELLLPEELYQSIWHKTEHDKICAKYAKVIMKLDQILEGEFFEQYVKKGMSNSADMNTILCSSSLSSQTLVTVLAFCAKSACFICSPFTIVQPSSASSCILSCGRCRQVGPQSLSLLSLRTPCPVCDIEWTLNSDGCARQDIRWCLVAVAGTWP